MMSRLQNRSGLLSKNAGTTPPPPSGRALLNANSDFTYLGKYIHADYFRFNGLQLFADGLTHRYDNGQLVFLYTSFLQGFHPQDYGIGAFTLPASFEQDCVPAAYGWIDIWNNWTDNGCRKGLWWEEEENRLWTASGFDYPQAGITINMTQTIMTRRLNSGTSGYLSTTDRSSWFGFQNIGQRALYGNPRRVPTWAQNAYGFHKYISLSGGYSSLMAQGLGVSLGPMFVAFPDPHLQGYANRQFYTDDWNIPSTDYQILADHRSGTVTQDWYSSSTYASRTKDRGCRTTQVQNYFEADDYTGPREGANGRPVNDPTNPQWTNPAPGDPDGYGRWSWDTFNATGNWIDDDAGTRNKHGIVTILAGGRGKNWYYNSTGHADGAMSEIHVYDPADLYAVKQGTLPPYSVRPKSIRQLPQELWGNFRGSGINGNAATFDPITNRLYVLQFGTGPNNYENHLHVFQVAA